MKLKNDEKSEEELTCLFKIDIRNLTNFDSSTQKSENSHFICHYNEEWCKNFGGIDLSVQNWHKGFDKFWPEHSKISKICTLMGCFWPRYIMFELKKYREVTFDGTKDWCKIWRKTGLCFGKWQGIWQVFTRAHSKSAKLGLWWNPFIQSMKCMSLKFTGELCVMKMKNDAKCEEKLTCHFKIDMRNLTNFDLNTRKSQKFALWWAAFDQSV